MTAAAAAVPLRARWEPQWSPNRAHRNGRRRAGVHRALAGAPGPDVLDLAFRMLLDLRDAEDVVQEAFDRLARAPDRPAASTTQRDGWWS